MDPKISKKTQDTLGKLIKKPPLTDKLLGKPPFRFLHDIVTSVIKTTGFMKGLFPDSDLNSENVKEKDSKIAFLTKCIDFVSFVNGKTLAAKPGKIIAGHEPERTNEFLQAIATAINKQVDNEECVNKFNKGGGKDEAPKEKSKDKDREERKKRESEEKKDREKSRDRDREKSRGKDGDREKSRDREKDEGRSKDRKDRDERHKDREERHKDREERHKDRDRRKKHDDESESMVNGDQESSEPQRPARPFSAKGARRRREGRAKASDDEDDEPPQISKPQPDPVREDDLPPQVANARKLARPSSARPAPPRRKQENIDQEPAMRLGTGAPTNVIVDDNDSDDDENFVVEESAPPIEQEQTITRPEDSDEEDHGGLVKKILETKKELEGSKQQQQRKTEVERPAMSDAQRRKQREQVQKEIDKLRNSIQTLTRSANPLGKIMDYVQEDLDSMQKELERWKTENKEHAVELKREKGITDKAIEPLKGQLAEVDIAIKDQLDLIAACKANILRNDQKIEKMLNTIAKS